MSKPCTFAHTLARIAWRQQEREKPLQKFYPTHNAVFELKQRSVKKKKKKKEK